MSSPHTARPRSAATDLPAVPLTLEGYSVLHQMMRVRWAAWGQLQPTLKAEIAEEAAQMFEEGRRLAERKIDETL